MFMTAKQLATKVLQYRGSSSLIVPGTLYADIGPEAMQDALNRRWVEADTETGYLRLSMAQGTIEEMQRLAENKCEKCSCDPCECCEKCGKHPCECPKGESLDPRTLLTAHTQRTVFEYTVPPAYGSGQPEKGQGPVVQMDPSLQNDPNRNAPFAGGEEVLWTDENKNTYQAKVKTVNRDGTYELSFGPNKPSQQRFVRKEELTRFKKPGNVTTVP